MTLVEMIEALQSKWQSIPTDHHLRPQDIRDWCERERTNSQLDCAKELTPLLAAARAQEQELAAMKEQFFPQGFPLSWLEAVRRMERQHDADLREVAIKTVNWTERIYGVLQCKVDRQKAADSIVREFREKQQKSKEGDARESGSSS